jgi:hypothetical protein
MKLIWEAVSGRFPKCTIGDTDISDIYCKQRLKTSVLEIKEIYEYKN